MQPACNPPPNERTPVWYCCLSAASEDKFLCPSRPNPVHHHSFLLYSPAQTSCCSLHVLVLYLKVSILFPSPINPVRKQTAFGRGDSCGTLAPPHGAAPALVDVTACAQVSEPFSWPTTFTTSYVTLFHDISRLAGAWLLLLLLCCRGVAPASDQGHDGERVPQSIPGWGLSGLRFGAGSTHVCWQRASGAPREQHSDTGFAPQACNIVPALQPKYCWARKRGSSMSAPWLKDSRAEAAPTAC